MTRRRESRGRPAVSGFHPPKQERSRQTLERLADAAVDLLESRPFGEISVDQIVERAGASKGAFYTRFDDKRALLDYLEAKRFDSVLRAWSDFLDPDRWSDRPLAEFTDAFVDRLFCIYRRSAGPMREFVRRVRIDPDPETRERGEVLNRHVVEGAREVVRRHPAELHHPDPDLAVETALAFVGAAARERLLFAWPAVDGSRDELQRELARAFRRYLGISNPETASRRSAPGADEPDG